MRIAVMNTNVFSTIIAAVKGAVSTSARKPMYEYIRLEFRRENKAVTAIATDGCRLFVEHATCFEIEEDFDCYIKPSVHLPRGQDMRLELKERSETESAVEIECLGCIFGFVQPVGEFLDAPTFRIGVNAEYLLSALQAAKASVGGTFKQPAILEFRGPIAPITIKTNREDVKMVLPVRIKEADNGSDGG